MMHWKAGLLGLTLLLATMTGCARQVFVSPGDYDDFHKRLDYLPPNVTENNAELGVSPLISRVSQPPTVIDPDREPRYISLQESIALSLENNSTTGIQSVRQPGGISDDLLSVSQGGGVPLLSSDSIRVLTLSPALAYAAVEAALSRFDPKWVTGLTWQSTDQPIQGFNSFNNGDSARFDTSLVKAFPDGWSGSLGFAVPYQFLSRPPANFPIVNPAYTPRAGVTLEGPLLQGFGSAINYLLTRHPGTGPGSQIPGAAQQFLNGGSGAGGNFQPSGIVIARIRFDQSRAEVERVVNFKLLNIEVAYWNLYGGYVNLYSIEQALRQTHEIWKIKKAKVDAGTESRDTLARALGQYNSLRSDRLQALGRVLEAERVLRALVGLPAEDGKRLVPIDTPTTAPYQPSWDAAQQDAMTLRPELIAARQELKVQQLNVITQKNFLKPDLRFVSGYFVNGLGNRLDTRDLRFDGSTGSFRNQNAFRSLAGFHNHDWDVGLHLNVPLGYRLENAAVRAAQLSLAQAYLSVQREEEKAQRFLVKAYRDVLETHAQIGMRRKEREAYADELKVRYDLIEGGKKAPDEFLLESVRLWSTALNAETQAIVNYNNALVTFEFAKGTIMQHDSVNIAEGPLPQCAYVRAVEHEHKRSGSLVLRQRSHLAPGAHDGPEDAAHLSSTPMLSTLVEPGNTPPSTATSTPNATPATPATGSRDVLSTDIFRPAQR